MTDSAARFYSLIAEIRAIYGPGPIPLAPPGVRG